MTHEISLPKHEKILKSLKIAVESKANVLLVGPTGCGKSTMARWIHQQGVRSQRPLVTVNLATVHEGTLESELFGHERGAFTGADARRVGRLEMAQGGTLFLDEIGELSLKLQARLLEFLQSRIIVPVGGNREIRLDVRVIAATHQDLAKLVSEGRFREDLYHRLRVIEVEMASLHSRQGEFNEIVQRVIDEFSKEYQKRILRINEAVALRLENYNWPGNIRELRNVLEYAVLSCRGDELFEQDLPEWFAKKPDLNRVDASFAQTDAVAEIGFIEKFENNYANALSRFEKDYLESSLSKYSGRINYTARKIGVNKTTLLRRLKMHGINASQFII